jgi:hypothetical protein
MKPALGRGAQERAYEGRGRHWYEANAAGACSCVAAQMCYVATLSSALRTRTGAALRAKVATRASNRHWDCGIASELSHTSAVVQ